MTNPVFKKGDVVRSLRHISEPADEYYPVITYCRKGDKLIIKEATPTYNPWIIVSHEKSAEEDGFCIFENEIELWDRPYPTKEKEK